jgi:hypothetical protein
VAIKTGQFETYRNYGHAFKTQPKIAAVMAAVQMMHFCLFPKAMRSYFQVGTPAHTLITAPAFTTLAPLFEATTRETLLDYFQVYPPELPAHFFSPIAEIRPQQGNPFYRALNISPLKELKIKREFSTPFWLEAGPRSIIPHLACIQKGEENAWQETLISLRMALENFIAGGRPPLSKEESDAAVREILGINLPLLFTRDSFEIIKTRLLPGDFNNTRPE